MTHLLLETWQRHPGHRGRQRPGQPTVHYPQLRQRRRLLQHVQEGQPRRAGGHQRVRLHGLPHSVPGDGSAVLGDARRRGRHGVRQRADGASLHRKHRAERHPGSDCVRGADRSVQGGKGRRTGRGIVADCLRSAGDCLSNRCDCELDQGVVLFLALFEEWLYGV